jgi:drug/metabolite transporter (DMT)-like permease
MEQTRSRKRPWLAALLSAVAPAFGHLYLRRWLRALGWLGLTALTTLFIPESTLDALMAGEPFAWVNIAPLLLVSVISVFDAYRLALVNNYLLQLRATDGEAMAVCPNCGRPVDDDLDFCQWCATPLDRTSQGR